MLYGKVSRSLVRERESIANYPEKSIYLLQINKIKAVFVIAARERQLCTKRPYPPMRGCRATSYISL